MKTRGYGQYCGFARALEVVGERWSMLVIRDLLVGPKRFTDLHRGLPGIPTNILTSRLKELEEAGIVRRRALARPERAIVYELTEYGAELEDVVIGLGRWGAKQLGDPRPDEVVTVDSMITAFRTTYQPKAAKGVHTSFELRMGDIVLHIKVDDGRIQVGAGPLADAQLKIEAGPAVKALLNREMTPAEAIKSGAVGLTGNKKLLSTFVDLFKIDPMPAPKPETAVS
jgi:DNA-binding HxlR family transcriptional regulator